MSKNWLVVMSCAGLLLAGCSDSSGGGDEENNQEEVTQDFPTPILDFMPGGEDDWPECVSDSGEYQKFEETISSAGRVGGFEEIADLLWRRSDPPTSADFLAAKQAYAPGEGLNSRVSRREDEHYAPVTDDSGEILRCRDEGVPELDPDRCVGPAQMLPLLNEAFRQGIEEEGSPWVHAARIEATLLWFLHVSTYKEAVTCTDTRKDCDSAYAYFTGDQQGGDPSERALGLASYFQEHSAASYEATWNGILAVRCWRDLDGGEEASFLDVRDRALNQMDRGLLHGLAHLLIWRLEELEQHSDEQAEADWAWLQILGPVILRDATLRDATKAAALRQSFESDDPSTVDADSVKTTLAELYPELR